MDTTAHKVSCCKSLATTKLKQWENSRTAELRSAFVNRMKNLPPEHIDIAVLREALNERNSAIVWKGRWVTSLEKDTGQIETELRDCWEDFKFKDIKLIAHGSKKYSLKVLWDGAKEEDPIYKQSHVYHEPVPFEEFEEEEEIEEGDQEDGIEFEEDEIKLSKLFEFH